MKLDHKCKQAVHKFETEIEQQLIDSGNVVRFYRYLSRHSMVYRSFRIGVEYVTTDLNV